MAGDEGKPRLSDDDEFAAALDMVAQLLAEKALAFIIEPLGGVNMHVDSSAADARIGPDATISAKRFSEILAEEIAPLLYPICTDMAEEDLIGPRSPYAELDEDNKARIVSRCAQLSAVLNEKALRAEFRAKSRSFSPVLVDLEFGLFAWLHGEGEDEGVPAAVVRIETQPSRGQLPKSGSPRFLRELLGGDAEIVTMTATLSDVRFMISKLEDLERKLSARWDGCDV